MIELIETKKLIVLKKEYENIYIKISSDILESDPSEMAITRMLIERNCYLKFIEKLGKLIAE
jgi:hypothetical protein